MTSGFWLAVAPRRGAAAAVVRRAVCLRGDAFVGTFTPWFERGTFESRASIGEPVADPSDELFRFLSRSSEHVAAGLEHRQLRSGPERPREVPVFLLLH